MPAHAGLKSEDDLMPRLFILLFRLWCMVSIGIMLLIIVAEGLIMNNSITRYHDAYGTSFPDRDYYTQDSSSETSGYVALTNAPKHLGSLIWTVAFQLSIILLCVLVGICDSAMVFSSSANMAQRVVTKLKSDHLGWSQKYEKQYTDTNTTREPFFVLGIAFLKLLITVAFMSQSFWGLSNGSNGIGAVAGATGQTYTAPNNVYWEQYEWRGRDLQSWQKRAIDGGGSASAEIDQQLFCLVSGFLLLGSIPLTLIAQAFTYLNQVNRGRAPPA